MCSSSRSLPNPVTNATQYSILHTPPPHPQAGRLGVSLARMLRSMSSLGEEEDDVGTAKQQQQQQALSGRALVRHGAWSLLLKKDWQPCFWVLREDKLLVFEQQADYTDGAGSGAQKVLPLTERLVLSPLKYKDYGRPSGPLFYFALEESLGGKSGLTPLLKFASTEEGIVERLRAALQDQLKEVIRRRIAYANKVVGNAATREKVVQGVIMKEHGIRSAAVAAGGGSPAAHSRGNGGRSLLEGSQGSLL